MPDVTDGASDDGGGGMRAIPEPAATPAGRNRVLVLGTTNAGKVRELLALIAPHGLTCRSLAEMAGAVEVDETGATFADNATLKAVMQARALGHWVLAEDSGLVVPALDGEPGVRSARFAGPPAPGDGTPADERNNRLLLDRLAGVSGRERSAWYACHAVLADPTGCVVAEATGTCHGLITRAPRGTGGFGYDPLFLVRECHRTFAEIGPSYKAIVSHRGRALRVMLPLLVKALRAA